MDTEAPGYIGINAPRTHIGPHSTTLVGTVIDASSVPTITVEFSIGGGARQTTVCANPTPTTEVWSCAIDVGTQADGMFVVVRVRATDVFGNVGIFSPWLTLTVDAQPPTLALDDRTQIALSDGVIGPNEALMSGTAVDDHLLSGVEVCRLDAACTLANLALDPATVPQAVFTYDDTPTTPIEINVPNVCGAGTEGIVRTFVITEAFNVSEVSLGLNVAHPLRSDLFVRLQGPDATTVDVVQFGSEVNAPNLDVLLTDATDQPVTTGREPHDLTLPYYDAVRLPSNSLSAFSNRPAAGDWTLTICDTNPGADMGDYNHAQLKLKADTLPQNTQGTWAYTYPFEESMDGIFQTLQVYALDSVGNRMSTPQAMTFMADNVAPQLVVTQTATWLAVTAATQPVAFTGVVSDAGGVDSVMLHLLSPAGQSLVAPANLTVLQGGGGTILFGTASIWDYTLQPFEVGDYTITVLATDRAGNTTSLGGYTIRVQAPVVHLTSADEYLPLETTQVILATVYLDEQQPVGAGVPVYFDITGPHAAHSGVATTDITGQAVISYTGTLTGTDSITATAVISGYSFSSQPLDVFWYTFARTNVVYLPLVMRNSNLD